MKEIKETCYKGTRILVGNEKRTFINLMAEYLIAKGYQEISIPIIQMQEIFTGKVGEENNNLMFNFTDRGNRSLCLAPEYCQTINTLISSEKGFLYFNEIGNVDGEKSQEINLNVYNDRIGEKDTATQFHVQGYKKVKEILLDSGITIECTLNHNYRVLDNGRYIFKKADELKVGDLLPYSVGEYNGGAYQKLSHSYIKKKNSNSKQVIKLPCIFDENISWLIGLYYADGCNLNRGFHIYGNKKQQRGFHKLYSILNEYNISYKYYEQKNDNRCYVSINCVELISFFIENGLLKDKSSNIEFPLIVRISPKSVIQAFIDGYLTGDGHVYPQGIGSTSISKKFIEQLTIIQRGIGVDGKYSSELPKNSFGKNVKYKYHSRKGRKTTKNNRQNGFKQLNELGFNNLLFDTIKSISNKKEFVFEISIPKTETYIANSYISHNTAVIQKLANSSFKFQKDIKLFYVQECFRGEKPQTGRYRQFTQFGVEIINPSKDYLEELINDASELIKCFNIEGFEINRNVQRGLDYYKEGKGFEISYDKLGSSKQICGGGEYKGGIGFAIGVDRLLNA